MGRLEMRLVMGGESLQGPLTGIGQYACHLAKEMLAREDLEDFQFFVHGRLHSPQELMTPSAPIAQKNSATGPRPFNINQLVGNIRSIVAKSTTAVAVYEWLMPIMERRALRHYAKDDVFHSPNYMLPDFPGRRIVSILDLSTYRFPEQHPEARVSFVNQHIERAIESADHIITISNLVKNEIVERFAFPAERITVTYLGADEAFRPLTDAAFDEKSRGTNLVYKGYFLFVSSIEPRKNLSRLLDAYLEYREGAEGPAIPLIVTGIPGWKSDNEHQRLKHLEARGMVRYLGYVSQEMLPILIAGATALVYPSLYEGFGLPVLEAMQSGTAVITSRGTSMAEIGGDAVRLVDAESVDSIAMAIAELSKATDARDSLEKKGLQQAQLFSWSRCAEETFSAYMRTVN